MAPIQSSISLAPRGSTTLDPISGMRSSSRAWTRKDIELWVGLPGTTRYLGNPFLPASHSDSSHSFMFATGVPQRMSMPLYSPLGR